MIGITPQEFHFEDTSNSVRCKTAVLKEQFKTDMLLRQIRHFRLGAGTIIKVQFMNKDYDVLLHSADFVIESAVDTRKRIIDERGEREAVVTEYKVVRDSDWKSYSEASEPVNQEIEREQEEYVPGEGEIRWNPGKKVYEVMVADEIFAEVKKRDDESREEFKQRALAIAAGSQPLSEAA